MSQEDDPGMIEQALRTVTPSYQGREDREMDTIGWGLFLGLAVLLVPLLPFIVIVWAISKVVGWGARRGARR